MARIPGFHPGGPGSIPGVGEFLFLLSLEIHPFHGLIISIADPCSATIAYLSMMCALRNNKKWADIKKKFFRLRHSFQRISVSPTG